MSIYSKNCLKQQTETAAPTTSQSHILEEGEEKKKDQRSAGSQLCIQVALSALGCVKESQAS